VARGGCSAGAIGERGGDRAEVGLLVNGDYEYIAHSGRIAEILRPALDVTADLRIHARDDRLVVAVADPAESRLRAAARRRSVA